MKRISQFLAAACLAISVHGAEPEAEPAPPALPGRPETNVVIQIKGGAELRMTYPAYPYADTNGYVTLLPGEKHVIEFELKDGQPINPKWVKKRTKGKNAITLKFTNDGEMAYLSTQSHCSKIITMKCRHQVAGRDGMYTTGLNPIKPGMFSGDSWSPQVVSLLLFDFKFWDDYDKAFEHER